MAAAAAGVASPHNAAFPRLGLALSGITADVDNPHHIQRRRAAVYATNHTSNVEPPIVFDALHELFPRLRILYKAELRKLPVLVRAFDLGRKTAEGVDRYLAGL